MLRSMVRAKVSTIALNDGGSGNREERFRCSVGVLVATGFPFRIGIINISVGIFVLGFILAKDIGTCYIYGIMRIIRALCVV